MKTEGESQLIVLGAGLFAQETADLVTDAGDWEVVGFVEGIDRRRCSTYLLGLPVHWVDDIGALRDSCRVICAIGSPARKAFIEKVNHSSMEFATFVHPSAHVSSAAVLGEGTIVSPGAVVASHAMVGRHVIVNRGSLIGHHCHIGDYTTISPGANIAGRTKIGECGFVGIGATIIDGLSIGEHSVVAAGAVVTRDVAAGTRVAGVPARQMRAPI